MFPAIRAEAGGAMRRQFLGFELAPLLPHCDFLVEFWFWSQLAVMCVQHWPAAVALEDARGLWGWTLLWCLHGVGDLKGVPCSGHVSSFHLQSFFEGPWRKEHIQVASQDHTDSWTVSNLRPFSDKDPGGRIPGSPSDAFEFNCPEMCSPKYI